MWKLAHNVFPFHMYTLTMFSKTPPHQFPKHNACSNRNIQGMFHSELWDLDAVITMGQYLLTYSFHFITKYQDHALACLPAKRLKRYASFCLLYCHGAITRIAQLQDRVHRGIPVFPFNRLRCSKGCFMNIAVGRFWRVPTEKNSLGKKGISRSKNASYIMHAADIFQQQYHR